ncbi:MAG: L-ascorbate metabolism protein UlaG (beta-lactamase superfamily) [Francisellaceae bacterium]|jgi:L-ascorbate metabolism protein UlaG (beta-lactamase superfamily)
MVSPKSGSYYLKEGVYVEPLINNWYAWPYLLSPFTYACYMKKTHLRLMKSFINNFELHRLGITDSTLVGGGGLVDCDEEHLELVKELVDKFETDNRIYIELQQALADLHKLLAEHKKGYSIEYLYEQVPEVLKGFVELNTDVNHNPDFRLIEPLIYVSPYYQENLQSMSFGLLSNVERRPFVLSTPRLPDSKHLHINSAFTESELDQIFTARTTPISEEKITSLFSRFEMKGGLNYNDLFTTEPPKLSYQLPEEGKVRFNHLGHAGLMIESRECNIMIDPVIASRGEDNKDQIISYTDLPPIIDYVLITHSHADHVNLETLLQLRHKIKTILVPKNNGGTLIDPSLKLMLNKLRFNVIELDEMESVKFEGGYLQSIPFLGEHGDLNIRSKTGWFINMHNKRIYAGADSSNLEPKLYDLVCKQTGALDIMAIGMECVGAPYTWLYGALNNSPLSHEQKETRRLNGSDAETVKDMIASFKPKQVYVYALGMERWFTYFMGLDYTDDSEQIVESGKLLDYCNSIDLPSERLVGKLTYYID